MELDTYSFFLIILEGFGLVWSFRKAAKRHKDIADFEYLGFSAFWGVVLFGLWQGTTKDMARFNQLIQSPYLAGAIFFVLAVIIGTSAGWCVKQINLLLKRMK